MADQSLRRRQAVAVAAACSSLGVVCLAYRESDPHPGRVALGVLITIGALTYVAPFALFVDGAIRRGRTSIRTVAIVGAVSVVFLATRRVGSFTQVWPAFTAFVDIAAILAVDQLRAVLAAALRRPLLEHALDEAKRHQ